MLILATAVLMGPVWAILVFLLEGGVEGQKERDDERRVNREWRRSRREDRKRRATAQHSKPPVPTQALPYNPASGLAAMRAVAIWRKANPI